jgi:hypothetical protein
MHLPLMARQSFRILLLGAEEAGRTMTPLTYPTEGAFRHTAEEDQILST